MASPLARVVVKADAQTFVRRDSLWNRDYVFRYQFPKPRAVDSHALAKLVNG
jgi:hypothetical protein